MGLAKLDENLTHSRLTVLERVERGIAASREDHQTVCRRQDRMLGDLDETRGELVRLREAVEALRPVAAVERVEDDARGAPEESSPGTEPGDEPGHGPAEPTGAPPPASSDTESQGGTMENSEHGPRSGAEDQDPDRGLKNAIEAAYRGPDGPAAPAAGSGAAEPDRDPRIAHGVLLLKAAGVASAELVAQHDTWEWLVALAVRHAHFRLPSSVEDVGGGRVRTVLSGRTLIALLIRLWDTHGATAALDGDWAMARTVYGRIAAVLTDVRGHGATIRIVLDDGLPEETDD
ncbi:hypothetical protein [Streptomyces tagetis]|uniref:hypothetical protein n=1 Tax=Streptomyces tagetis TaxID=2820809 RepID=UPI0027DCA935|nr:hypothetical protein [Streptomyces sp. RG38]